MGQSLDEQVLNWQFTRFLFQVKIAEASWVMMFKERFVSAKLSFATVTAKEQAAALLNQ